MPLPPKEALNYRGHIQPDRWKLHLEDFRIRMDWEYERQRILNAQAEAIKDGLAYPKEKIPPIPLLKHPGYHLRLREVTQPVTVTEKPQSAVTPVTGADEEKRRKNREKVARHRAKLKGT